MNNDQVVRTAAMYDIIIVYKQVQEEFKLEYKSIIRNESKSTWVKTVFDDIITETPIKGEALVFGDEHCAQVSLDYLNGTLDDCFILEQL